MKTAYISFEAKSIKANSQYIQFLPKESLSISDKSCIKYFGGKRIHQKWWSLPFNTVIEIKPIIIND